MNTANDDRNDIRFDVEIMPEKLHFECKGLSQVLAATEAHGGAVRIFDCRKGKMVFAGSAAELRERLWPKRDVQRESLLSDSAVRTMEQV